MNFNHYEGKGMDINEIIGIADTMPFFAERRLVLIEDSGWFKGGAGGEEMSAYMEHIPDTTCLVFVETEVDKRSKLFKAVKKIRLYSGAWPSGCVAAWPLGCRHPVKKWEKDHRAHHGVFFKQNRG